MYIYMHPRINAFELCPPFPFFLPGTLSSVAPEIFRGALHLDRGRVFLWHCPVGTVLFQNTALRPRPNPASPFSWHQRPQTTTSQTRPACAHWDLTTTSQTRPACAHWDLQDCWEEEADQRPSFKTIIQRLQNVSSSVQNMDEIVDVAKAYEVAPDFGQWKGRRIHRS
jgi:hypothetical protein